MIMNVLANSVASHFSYSFSFLTMLPEYLKPFTASTWVHSQKIVTKLPRLLSQGDKQFPPLTILKEPSFQYVVASWLFLLPTLAEEVIFSVASVCVCVSVRLRDAGWTVFYPIDSREVRHEGIFIYFVTGQKLTCCNETVFSSLKMNVENTLDYFIMSVCTALAIIKTSSEIFGIKKDLFSLAPERIHHWEIISCIRGWPSNNLAKKYGANNQKINWSVFRRKNPIFIILVALGFPGWEWDKDTISQEPAKGGTRQYIAIQDGAWLLIIPKRALTFESGIALLFWMSVDLDISPFSI